MLNFMLITQTRHRRSHDCLTGFASRGRTLATRLVAGCVANALV
jgi:hypothetical protein